MSSDVFSKGEKHRVLSFTKLKLVTVVGGESEALRDTAWKNRLDYYVSVSVMNAGHCPPKVTRVKSISPTNMIGGRS